MGSGFTLTCQANPTAIVDPGRDFDHDSLGFSGSLQGKWIFPSVDRDLKRNRDVNFQIPPLSGSRRSAMLSSSESPTEQISQIDLAPEQVVEIEALLP